MKEAIKLQGLVTFDVFNEIGRHIRTIDGTNLVTTLGKNYLVRRIISDASAAGSAIDTLAVGDDGSTAASESNTELNNQVAEVEIDTIFDTDNIAGFTTIIPIGVATGTIAEAGLYTNDTTPILVSHIVLSTPFTKASNESIQVNWQLKLGNT